MEEILGAKTEGKKGVSVGRKSNNNHQRGFSQSPGRPRFRRPTVIRLFSRPPDRNLGLGFATGDRATMV
jgi:hypothetical protein